MGRAVPSSPIDPPIISADQIRHLALQLRAEHDGRTQGSVLASIDPHPRCSVCHYTRHPCAVFELADDVLTYIDRDRTGECESDAT